MKIMPSAFSIMFSFSRRAGVVLADQYSFDRATVADYAPWSTQTGMANDVIAAIATPTGRGGIGVVRVSGPRLTGLLRALVKTDVIPRRATRAEFRNADGGVIDQGLVLYFPAPHSYTGEDVIELQGHGGPVVMQLVL
jgi:hypothetical protein